MRRWLEITENALNEGMLGSALVSVVVVVGIVVVAVV